MHRNRLPSLFTASRSGRGFSLIEVMVASAVFLMIMLAVYQVYMRSLEGHKQGVQQAELIQSTRFGFEEMATRIRSAGFEFDLDGAPSTSPNQSDESIEYMGATAIVVRANYDFASEAFRGREERYEALLENEGFCCPIVTTGNDEILAFALGKNDGAPDQPTETMTLYLDLDAPRDGQVSNDTGLIVNEETVEIPNVALTDFSDPPYVLYQFTWSDPFAIGGLVLERRPLVDNILALEFKYLDEGGNDLSLDSGGNEIGLPGGGPNPGSDGDPAHDSRNRRERVRKVQIFIKAMTPEPDLRYVDDDDPDPVTQKHRKWELVEEVHTFNVGRRGQKDKSTDPPTSVTDVQLCSGQCGLVRVDWLPGPPEDRISDHVVILAECVNGSNPSYDTPLASAIVVSDLDLTTHPEREFAIFDLDDDPDLIAGKHVCARVIPRDSSGLEADEPSDSDKNTELDDSTSNDFTIIVDYSRSEAPSGGAGSGYDSADDDWPDAQADNSDDPEITTDDGAESYPLANRIQISFDTPRFVLDRLSTGGSNLYDWTTNEAAGTAALEDDVDAGEICHRVELSPDDGVQDFRTPNEELARSKNDNRPNVYVFRVSGSDRSNWGPDQDDCDPAPGPNCIDEPGNFMPHAGNLHAYYAASMTGNSFSFLDASESRFYRPPDVTDQYLDRYLSTGTASVRPTGELAPVKALTPGEVYYYRVRIVDICWTDSDADGVEDGSAGTAEEIAAWSTVDDFAGEDDWREAAVVLSPFYPPLIPLGSTTGERDVPTDGGDDSDAVGLTDLALVATYALPGYARPEFVQGTTYVRPEKPSEFYLSRANDSASALFLPDGDGNPGVRVLFNSAKRSAPQDTDGEPDLEPTSVGYSFYRLKRKLVAYTAGLPLEEDDVDWEEDEGTLVAEFRLSEAGLREYTIDRRGEVFEGMNSALSNDALYLATTDGAGSDVHYYYKLFTAQVTEGLHHDPLTALNELPIHVADDGITPDSARYSLGSRGFLWPAPFYDHVERVRVEPNNNGIGSSSVDVFVDMVDGSGSAEPNCVEVKSARLLAYDRDTDQFLGSSDWIETPDDADTGDCEFEFNATLVEQALRTYPDQARFRVELSDVNEESPTSGGEAWDKQPRGARVRSDLVGEAGDYALDTSCPADCGILGGQPAAILGEVDETRIETEENDHVLVVDIPIDGCNTTDFKLLQLDVVLDRGGQPMPEFLGATLGGLRSGVLALPDPEFEAEDGGNFRLRWFEGSFCDQSGVCEFPVVLVTPPPQDPGSITLRLRFAGPVCDPVRLEGFNFRVPVSGGAELLCSDRGEYAPDALGEADEPDHYCQVGGDQVDNCGRGPALNPVACGQTGCEPACPLGRCPANSDFSVEPSTFLEENAAGDPDTVVRIEQREDCSGSCPLTLTQIIGEFTCDHDDRDCDSLMIPGFVSAELVHEDGTRETLPAPLVDRDPVDYIELRWTGLTDFAVEAGEIFGIEMLFDGTMADTEATTWHLQFGRPLEATTNCDWVPIAPDSGIDIPNSN